MNIPGLDAPSWSRVSGTDEAHEEQEEAREEARWNAQQQSKQPTVQFTAAAGNAAAAPVSCDVLVLACGMMSSAFLSAMLDRNAASAASAPPAATPAGLREVGRFTLPTSSAASAASSAALPSDLAVGSSATKAAKAAAARPYALVLARQEGDEGTLIAFNYLRPSMQQYHDITQALFQQVAPKRVPELESPNLVFSYAASVLSHCEVARIPAQLYISLESRHYVLETLQAFEELFRTLSTSGSSLHVSALLLASASTFLSDDAAARRRAYRAATQRLQQVYAYSAGQDSSMRETAAEVQRDHMDDMFY